MCHYIMKKCPKCGIQFTPVTHEQLVKYLQKINPKMSRVLEMDKIAHVTESLFCEGCGNYSLSHDHTK